MNRHFEKAHADTAAHLTERLREHALNSGWPDHLAQALTIAHHGDGFHATYPDHLRNAILDLEEGTPGTPPNPVLHRFANRADNISGGLHEDNMMRALWESGVI